MDIEVHKISFFMLFEAGLRYGVNPASFLGLIFFVFFLIRSKKLYDHGVVRPGVLFLFPFFVVQTMIHLGFFDFSLLFMPGAIIVWDIFRIFWALACFAIGIKCAAELFLRKDFSANDVLRKIFYWKLKTECSSGSKTRRRRFSMTVISVLWGIFFAFFSGLWPLHQSVVFLIYNYSLGLEEQFLFKILFFELIAVLPLVVVLFFVLSFFRMGSFWQGVYKKRLVVWIFSAVCIGAGIGTLIYYVQGFI